MYLDSLLLPEGRIQQGFEIGHLMVLGDRRARGMLFFGFLPLSRMTENLNLWVNGHWEPRADDPGEWFGKGRLAVEEDVGDGFSHGLGDVVGDRDGAVAAQDAAVERAPEFDAVRGIVDNVSELVDGGLWAVDIGLVSSGLASVVAIRETQVKGGTERSVRVCCGGFVIADSGARVGARRLLQDRSGGWRGRPRPLAASGRGDSLSGRSAGPGCRRRP